MDSRRGYILTLLLACTAVIGSMSHASTTFQVEAEGYLDPGNNFYLRALHGFGSPNRTIGLLGYTQEWKLPNQQNIRGFLWYRVTDKGDNGKTQNWIGPEIWPHINLGPKLTLDAEIRYLFGIGDDTKNHLGIFAWPMYQLDSKNSIGLIVTHTEIIDGPSQPWFLGPQYVRTLDSSRLLVVNFVEGLEEGAGQTLTVDYVWRYK